MALIKQSLFKFKKSSSPDVEAYKIYCEDESTEVTYDSTNVKVSPTPDTDGFLTVSVEELFPGIDGVFNIGITAVDDVGNESDMSKAHSVPLDFQAPAAPGVIEIIIE